MDFTVAAEDFMGAEGFTEAVVISAGVAAGMVMVTAGAAVVMGGMEVGIEVVGTGAAGTGMEVIRIGMVALPIGGGVTDTLMGITVGKSQSHKQRRTADEPAVARGYGG